MLLAIDTSTRYAGVAVFDGEHVNSSHCWYSAVNHTKELMPAVSQALKGQGLLVGGLRGIAVALGPGGFSALRVGLSVAKGLALTASLPIVGVGTLDLEAHAFLQSDEKSKQISGQPGQDFGPPVCAILDAGRNEVASALFGSSGQRLREDLICSIEELAVPLGEITEITGVKQETTGAKAAEPTLFCGEGVINWGQAIREHFGPGAIVVQPSPAARLSALCRIGWERLASGNTSDLASFQPTYLRMPSIGGPKRRDWAPQRS